MGRILVTGGAGFVGANLCVGLAARHPTGSSSRSTTCGAAAPSSTSRGCARRGWRSCTATCATPEDLAAVGDVDALIECSAEPSVMAGIDDDIVGTEPVRRLPLPGARAPRRRAVRLPLHQPRLSGGRARAPAAARGRDALRARTRAAAAGRLGRRHRRGASRSRARARCTARRSSAAEHLITEYAGTYGLAATVAALRRDRRPVADGQVRPGRVQPLAALPSLRATARLHRLRRHRQAGARPAARRRPASTSSRTSCCARTTGRARRSTSAAGGRAACRCSRRRRCAAS